MSSWDKCRSAMVLQEASLGICQEGERNAELLSLEMLRRRGLTRPLCWWTLPHFNGLLCLQAKKCSGLEFFLYNDVSVKGKAISDRLLKHCHSRLHFLIFLFSDLTSFSPNPNSLVLSQRGLAKTEILTF